MPSFSVTSFERLETCDVRLQKIMLRAITRVDFAISDGHRGEADQNALKAGGLSQLEFPNSKHNRTPSLAVDIVPYVPGVGAVWNDDRLWNQLYWYVQGIADGYNIPITWGGHWKNFVDKPHFELQED